MEMREWTIKDQGEERIELSAQGEISGWAVLDDINLSMTDEAGHTAYVIHIHARMYTHMNTERERDI